MGFIDRLKKLGGGLVDTASRVYDQANVFDDGRSFTTRTPTTTQSVGGQIRNILDANNIADREARLRRGQPEFYREQQIAQGNKRPFTNIGQQFLGNTERFGRTLAGGISTIPSTIRGEIAMRTGNQEALQNALEAQRNIKQVAFDPNRGAGTIYDTPGEFDTLGAGEVAKRVGLNTLGTASEVLPFARVGRAAQGGKLALAGNRLQTGNRAIRAISNAERGSSGLIARLATNAGIDATTGAGESVARQYAQTGQVDPKVLLGDVAANTLLGTAPVLGGEALTRARNPVTQVKARNVAGKATLSRVAAQQDATVRSLDDRITKAVKNAETSTGKLKQNYLQEARNLIQQRNARTKQITQGGFIGGGRATGFGEAQKAGRVFDGVDGKPRFEVSDEGAKIIAKSDQYGLDIPKGSTLEQVLDHPRLYEQYPELRKTRVEINEDLAPGEAGFDDARGVIELSPEARPDTVLHEIQHAIQQKEGFAMGGEVKETVDKARLLKEYPELTQWQKRLKEINDFYGKNMDEHGSSTPKNWTKEQRAKLAKEQYTLEGNIRRAESTILLNDYKNLAGEAEARAVANRMNMTDAERYKSLLETGTKDKPLPEMKKEFENLLEKVRNRKATDADYSRYDVLKDRIAVAEGKKRAPNPERWVSDKPIKMPDTVYRGTSENTGSGMAMFGAGKYTAASRAEAAKYGKVSQLGRESLPDNPLQFRTMLDFQQWEYEMARKLGVKKTELYATDTGAESLVNALGHDGVTIGTGKDMIAVKYTPEQIGQYQPQSTFYDSLDVPKEDLIIRDGTGRAMSIDTGKLDIPDKYVKEYADMLKSMDDTVRGGQMLETPEGSYVRTSEHSPFYRQFFAENGKKPTKADWIEEAKRQLDSGDAPSDVYDYIESAKEADIAARNKPSKRMSKAEKESLFESVPYGTERPIKVSSGSGESNIPVFKESTDRDVLTRTNVNDNIKAREQRFSIDNEGKLIEDTKGAHRLFRDSEGNVTGVRVGKKYYSSEQIGDLSQVNGYGSSLATMRRNVERAFDKQTGEKVNRFLVDHQQKQATKMIQKTAELTDGMNKLADDLGINFRKNRKQAKRVSAAIQEFGENKRTLKSLEDEFGKDYAQKIVAADAWFRQKYDGMLEAMNRTLTEYGYDPVPKRSNYYTHFQDKDLWKKFGLKMQEFRNASEPTLQDAMPDSARGKISNQLAGMSEFTQPNKRFNPFTLQRKGDDTVVSAFESFERYMNPTLNNIYMTPSITRARVISKAVAESADLAGKDANALIVQMREWANRIAGKSNRFDRPLLDSKWGNKVVKGLQFAQRRAGANTIVGNLATATKQPIVMAQAAGKFGYKNSILGVLQGLGDNAAKQAEKSSDFLNRRYTNIRQVTRSRVQRGAEIANMPLETVEEFTGRSVWRSAYNDAIEQGIEGKNAIRYADVQAEKTLAGRAIGERPELFESKAAGVATMYQLEVNNFWQQIGKEMTKEQAAKTLLATFAISSLMEQVTGYGIGFNPIDAAIDSYGYFTDEDSDILEATKKSGQRFTGEVLDNTPIAGQFIDFAAGSDQLKALAGEDSNIGKFGASSPVSTLVKNPSDWVTPFGGSQIRKTKGAIEDLLRGYADNRAGNPTYATPTSLPGQLQSLLYGSNATQEAKKYYEQDQRAVTGKQDLENLMASGDRNAMLRQIQESRMAKREGKEPSGDVVNSSDTYKLIEDAFRKSDGELKGLLDYDQAEVKQAVNKANDDLRSEMNTLGLPILQSMKFDSRMAQEFAKYQNGIDGKNEIEVKQKASSFYRSLYTSQLDDLSQSFLSLQSDDDMYYEAINGTVSQEQLDKIVQVDNFLTAYGLQSSPKLGKELRRKLGYGDAPEVGSRSKSGRRSKYNFSIPSGFSLVAGGSSRGTGAVQQLLRNARVDYKS